MAVTGIQRSTPVFLQLRLKGVEKAAVDACLASLKKQIVDRVIDTAIVAHLEAMDGDSDEAVFRAREAMTIVQLCLNRALAEPGVRRLTSSHLHRVRSSSVPPRRL